MNLSRGSEHAFNHRPSSAEITTVIPSEFLDRMIYALRCMVEMTVRFELLFSHHLDASRLEKALLLLLDAEPVTGCRFKTDRYFPYWERIEHMHRSNLRVAHDLKEYEAYKLLPLDIHKGPQVEACLLQQDNGSKLILKVAHEIADGGGLKQIAEVLSDIYTHLDENPYYRPCPNIEGSRDHKQILQYIPRRAYPQIIIHHLQEMWGHFASGKTLTLELPPSSRTGLDFIIHLLDEDRVARIAAYGRTHGATLNDMFLTGVLQAMARIDRQGHDKHLRVATTVDMRRYVPDYRGEGICNLSSGEFLYFGSSIGTRFNDTLQQVKEITRRRKAAWYGLNSYIGMIPFLSVLSQKRLSWFFESVFRQLINRNKYPSVFTNGGIFDASDLYFDGHSPQMLYALMPPVYPPVFGLAMIGYKGTLQLSTAVYQGTRERVEQFFEIMLKELP